MVEIANKEFLDRGKRGLAYTGYYQGGKVLVKEHNPKSDANTIANEATMLQKLNGVGIGPKFIAYESNQLIREFIDGERIEDFLSSATVGEAKQVLRELLLQCKQMDDSGINKFEMNHPYKHVLISRRSLTGCCQGLRVTMIDFERCKFTEKPKNVTQACQYIARLQPLLASIGLMLDTEKIKELGMQYKQKGYDEMYFEKLVEVFA